MDLICFKNDKNIIDIIAALGWTTFCGKLDEGALNMVKEFYAIWRRSRMTRFSCVGIG